MRRRDRVSAGFMLLWLTFWASAILVAVWHFGAMALAGEAAPAVFLVVWLAAAGFGLWSGARRLRQLLLGEAEGRRAPPREHGWRDGFDRTGPPA
jgi:hypothetical protein